MDGWRERIEAIARGRRVAVVGVGNLLRGDDGAGCLVARRLAASGNLAAFDAGTVPENHLGPLLRAAPDVAVFVDAADHGAEPGAVCVARALALGARLSSTHAPSLRLLASLLEASRIECWVVGIQPSRCGLGSAMTAAVRRAVREVGDALAGGVAPAAAHAEAADA
jgi:hydrogenase maturation protease